MKHILSLEVPAIYNPKLLWVKDTSQYATSPKVDCARLIITSPGYNVPQVLDVEKGFDSTFSACALGIQSSDCSSVQQDIPDGIYIIRYAVSPIDKVYVEYNHLRVTNITNKYMQEMGKLLLGNCSPSDEVDEQLRELRLIKNYIDAAKAKVEYAHKPKDGIDILTYAGKQLAKFSSKTC